MNTPLPMTLPEAWYVVATSSEAGRKPRKIRRFGVDLALWRNPDGGVHLVDDRCPHRGASLSAGRVRNGCIECPFHGFLFSGDGECTHIPAHGDGGTIPRAMRVRAYRVAEKHGFIWAWYGAERGRYPDIPFFEDLDGYRVSGFVRTWDCHFTRALENQLDFAHLPFVHRTTIGMNMQHEMTVETVVDDNRLSVWLTNGPMGSSPVDGPPMLELLMPCLWRNRIGDKTYGFAAYVPVSEDETRIYMRWYQRIVTVPGLAGAFGWASNMLNRRILAQDERVVSSQPGAGELRGGEVLIPVDRPIIELRRWMAVQTTAKRLMATENAA